MILKKQHLYLIFALTTGCFLNLSAQIAPNVYHSVEKNQGKDIHHELKINDHYLIYTVFSTTPAKFIKTVGGFYETDGGTLKVKLEFNSNYKDDNFNELTIPYSIENNKLVLKINKDLVFQSSETSAQDLDGNWLFATRGPDSGQERRGDENPRKTLKFLRDGHFQWIAYNTESMDFFGTGGGTFTSKDGVYVEKIQFFSRDDSRVGALLQFNYDLKNGDWHHKGKNSKGEPMYEIWARRTLNSL